MADTAVTQIRPSSSGTTVYNMLNGKQDTLGGQNSINNGIVPNAGVMRFPIDLESFDYWMSFSFYQYRRPTFAGNPVLSDQGTIKLPLPAQLRDGQSVDFNKTDLSPATGAGLNALSGSQSSGGTIDTVRNAALAVGAGAAVQATQNLTGDVGAGVGQIFGLAVNPWTTIMFKGPAYRQHSFTWILTPSNEAESSAIYNMINTFKFNMLPDTSGAAGGTLLTYPNICQIHVRNGKSNNWNYIFKPAVITSMDVNYAGAGQPSFFGVSKAPTAVEIRLNFQEIEFFLQRDYGTPSSTGAANIKRASDIGLGNIVGGAAIGVAAAVAVGKALRK